MVHVETGRAKATGLVLRNTDLQRIAEAPAARSQQHFLVLKSQIPFPLRVLGLGCKRRLWSWHSGTQLCAGCAETPR